MEQLNALEKLNVLEKKIISLLDSLKAEKELNAMLVEEKNLLMAEKDQLLARLDTVEGSLLKGTKNMEELSQMQDLTKMAVDDLIHSIDRLIGQEQR
jgi:regulator of replication initiation timing